MSEYSLGAPHLTRKIKLAYGVGHVLNDCCASMWFTYLMVYFQYVMNLDKWLAGFLLLLGQISDALSTPFVGFQSDKGCASGFCRYGRRKTWHLIGTLCVLISFPFIFILCWTCSSNWFNSYVTFIAFMTILFQFGWSSTQVSHLAMIPDLSPNEEERDELNIIRYFFDVLSDVLVYTIVWISFQAKKDPGESKQIDPTDYTEFRTTTICILVIGATFSLLFHIFTPEAPWNPLPSEMSMKLSSDDDEEDTGAHQRPALPSGTAQAEDLSLRISMNWKDWLLEPQFYYISLIYTSARLVSNLSTIYMPIYLQETIIAREELITLMPLIMSLAGIVASLMLKGLRKFASKKASMVIAALIGFIACIISSIRPLNIYGLYIIAIFFGLSGSLLIILSLAFTADLIGYCTDSSAFVYGSISFWDKLINGLAVFLIQELTSIGCDGDNCSAFYRMVMSVGIMVPLLLILIGLWIIASVRLGRTKKMRKMLVEEHGSRETTPTSSDSSEFLVATDSKLGYGAIARI